MRGNGEEPEPESRPDRNAQEAEDHRLDNTIRYSNAGIRDLQHGAAILFSEMVSHDDEWTTWEFRFGALEAGDWKGASQLQEKIQTLLADTEDVVGPYLVACTITDRAALEADQLDRLQRLIRQIAQRNRFYAPKLAEAGLLVPHWPGEWGGAARPPWASTTTRPAGSSSHRRSASSM